MQWDIQAVCLGVSWFYKTYGLVLSQQPLGRHCSFALLGARDQTRAHASETGLEPTREGSLDHGCLCEGPFL